MWETQQGNGNGNGNGNEKGRASWDWRSCWKLKKNILTPLVDNSSKKSNFAKKMEVLQGNDIKPEFLDFKKDIIFRKLKQVFFYFNELINDYQCCKIANW